jgi:hypothetical protein
MRLTTSLDKVFLPQIAADCDSSICCCASFDSRNALTASIFTSSEVAIIGYLAALAVPPYQYISTSCKGERLQQPRLTETCRGIARAFQHGDTYLTEMMGVMIAKRVWREESPERKAASTRKRIGRFDSLASTKS